MNRPTEAEVRAEPAGRQLDAWVAEIVCGWWIDHKSQCGFEWVGVRRGESHVENITDYSSNWVSAGPLLESRPDMAIHTDDQEVLLMGDKDPSKWIAVEFDRTKPNDLCRAICVALILAELAK